MGSTQTISQPDINATIVGASVATPNAAQKILFVGQKTAGGSAVSGDLQEDIDEIDYDSKFGKGSMLNLMLKAAKKVNKVNQFDAIALSDAGGGALSAGKVEFTGPATEDGTIEVVIGSKENGTYAIAVADADTADDIGAALAAAITADDYAPFTAANVSGSVTITAKNKGPEGNGIGIKVSGTVAGVVYSVTKMTSGSGVPTLTNLFDVIKNKRYQTIIWPGAFTLSVLTTLLTDRWPADNMVLDGVGIVSVTDTHANHKTALNALNQKCLVRHCNALVADTYYKGSAIFELDTVISAIFGATRALRLTPDQPISEIVAAASNGPRDAFGGDAIRSLPYFNTVMQFIGLVETGKGFDFDEIEELTTAGGFVLGNNIAGNTLICGEVPTTYKTDTAGNADLSFKYLNYVDTMSGIREYFFNNRKSRYAQTRLTEGEILPGRNMANEASIKTFGAKLFKDMTSEDYVLCQAGEAALKYFKDNHSVTLDMANGKVTEIMKTPIVTQLRTMVMTIQLSFSVSE